MMERAEEGDDEENDVEGSDSEACVDLLDYAGGVLIAFGSAMTPQRFAPYFVEMLPAILHRAVSLIHFYVLLSIYLSDYCVCRGSIARLRKSISVPGSCRCAWNRWMPFWNRWYRLSTRLLPT